MKHRMRKRRADEQKIAVTAQKEQNDKVRMGRGVTDESAVGGIICGRVCVMIPG